MATTSAKLRYNSVIPLAIVRSSLLYEMRGGGHNLNQTRVSVEIHPIEIHRWFGYKANSRQEFRIFRVAIHLICIWSLHHLQKLSVMSGAGECVVRRFVMSIHPDGWIQMRLFVNGGKPCICT